MMDHTIKLQSGNSLIEKIQGLHWGLIFTVTALAIIGFMALYSAAGGNYDPWASRQITRFAMGFVIMMFVAIIDLRWWFKLSWPLYFIGLGMLLVVEIMGHIGMGAQRWINLGFMQLQPSEIMKIALVMVLARHFHAASLEETRRLTFLILPALLILVPVFLVFLQPDLGTALMTGMAGAAMIFIAGAPLWIFIGAVLLAGGSVPVVWHFFLHEYQKKRVMTFINPESDPLGAGYHITQSKIALGSGGVSGKGFLEGSQSHLNFLPEKQTDFIFTLWAEEWGLWGGLLVLVLFGIVFFYGFLIASRSRNNFGRYLAMGLTINFSLYVFINIAMVMGLIPVVGAPLPLISYGGTAMLAAMISFGLMMSCSFYRESKMSRA